MPTGVWHAALDAAAIKLGENLPLEYRCEATAKRTGKRCGCRRMTGSRFCRKHGGRQETGRVGAMTKARRAERANARHVLDTAPDWVQDHPDVKRFIGKIGWLHASYMAEALMQGDRARRERLLAFEKRRDAQPVK